MVHYKHPKEYILPTISILIILIWSVYLFCSTPTSGSSRQSQKMSYFIEISDTMTKDCVWCGKPNKFYTVKGAFIEIKHERDTVETHSLN